MRRGGERLLFDCGEGTQRQLLRSDVGLVDLEEIFLTHFHADHFLGLPGMLKTFALRGREVPLTLYGPGGLGELLGALRRIFGRLTYGSRSSSWPRARRSRATATSCGPSRRATARRRSATRSSSRSGRGASTSRPPTRSASPRPGARSAPARRGRDAPRRTGGDTRGGARPGAAGAQARATGDTAPAERRRGRAGADVLVHEATFCEDEAERARETEHSTALEAARVARDAGVKLLALTHISSRYFGGDVEREAREVFPETVVPRDFDMIEVPFPERAVPSW